MAKYIDTLDVETIENRYKEVTKQLTHYRNEYMSVQRQYPPESMELIRKLEKINALLAVLKEESIELYHLQKEHRTIQGRQLAKTEKRRGFFRKLGKGKRYMEVGEW